MLVVALTVHPGGDAARAESIGTIHIANQSGLAPVSDYLVEIFNPHGRRDAAFVVERHRRSDGAWTLVARARLCL